MPNERKFNTKMQENHNTNSQTLIFGTQLVQTKHQTCCFSTKWHDLGASTPRGTHQPIYSPNQPIFLPETRRVSFPNQQIFLSKPAGFPSQTSRFSSPSQPIFLPRPAPEPASFLPQTGRFSSPNQGFGEEIQADFPHQNQGLVRKFGPGTGRLALKTNKIK